MCVHADTADESDLMLPAILPGGENRMERIPVQQSLRRAQRVDDYRLLSCAGQRPNGGRQPNTHSKHEKGAKHEVLGTAICPAGLDETVVNKGETDWRTHQELNLKPSDP